MKKTVLHTDREPETPLEKIEKNLTPVLDKTKEQITVNNIVNESPKKEKSNGWIWAIVTVVVILIIIGLMYYVNLQRKQNENATA